MSIVVEAVTEADASVLDAMHTLVPQLSRSAAPLTLGQLREIVEPSTNTLFVARDENGIYGTLTLVVFRIPSGLRAWIEDVIVDEGARGLGVGEMLTKVAIEKARALGAVSVDLTSRPSREAANRLYLRMGFLQRETNVYRFSLEG